MAAFQNFFSRAAFHSEKKTAVVCRPLLNIYVKNLVRQQLKSVSVQNLLFKIMQEFFLVMIVKQYLITHKL